MGLQADAEKLLHALESVAAGLADFQGLTAQMMYTKRLHHGLKPLIDDVRNCIAAKSDRAEILDIMAAIKALMSEVSGAATKGEMRICAGEILDTFWTLSTIFQEQRYRDEPL